MNFRRFLLLLIIPFLFNCNVYSNGIGNGSAGSPNISGIINTYTNVLAINPATCTSGITVFSSTGFVAGDLVLIIQMEGATVNTSNTIAYGNIVSYNNAGNFEYARIFSVAGNLIQTVAPLNNVYDFTGAIQLIRVPQYQNPVINGTLTCPAWNGLTGGIVVLDATGTITFNADIDVTGKGFRGGQAQPGVDFHMHLATFTALNFPDSFSLKGEGIASYSIVPFVSGRGAAANGGGGGNNHNAGGGGGANGGCGGNGGYGFSDTSLYGTNYIDPQGLGGHVLSNAGPPLKIFMGGGGGAGNADNASNCSGGNGGGIVLISSGFINGNTRFIRADGNSAAATIGDGSGGGGSGGTIVNQCSIINSALNFSLKGGSGGNGTSFPYLPHGPGGGGGGGIAAFTSPAIPSNLTINTIIGGAAGLCDGIAHGAIAGCNGLSLFNFAVPQSVTNPTVTTFSDTSFCNSGQLSLTATVGAAYSWSPVIGLSCTNCQVPMANVNTTTTYVATVTQSSCIFIDSFLVVIHPLPAVGIGSISDVCIDALPLVLSSGSPNGGIYNGTAVNAGVFNPALAGAGTYTITYTYNDSNNCVNSDSTTLSVNALPIVTMGAISPVCISLPSFLLTTGAPAGGNYSGPGVVGGNFDPAIAGSGSHTLFYSFTDGNGCEATDSAVIVVNSLPVVSVSPLADVCEGSPSFILAGGMPTGGIFSGNGVTLNTFDPLISGTGSHTIVYTVTDSNGCVNSDSTNITVNQLPNVLLAPLSPVCIDNSPIILANGLPLGGSYSGTAVSSGIFDPSQSGSGSFGITYVYTNGMGCTDSAFQNIIVNDLPLVSLGNIGPFCISASPINLNSGSPAGGIYSGSGVSMNNFDPSVSGPGDHQLIYSYSDSNSCLSSDTITVSVYDIPVVVFSSISPVCAGTPSFLLTTGSPAGGIYSGNGVLNGSFNTSISGTGNHVLVYTVTDTNNCINTDSTVVVVNSLPNVSFSALIDICIDAPSFALTGGLPLGGQYIGTAVAGGFFDPSISGAGTFIINYNYTDVNGCSDSANTAQSVNALPVVTLASINPVCISSPPFLLNTGLPAGGIYSGQGVSGNSFDPAIAGIGSHLITYTYSNANACVSFDTTTVTVYDVPAIVISSVSPLCEGTPAFGLTGASPAGGVFSGAGISGSTFNPAVAGVGIHNIVYFFTDANGCSNADSISITVNTLPVVTLNALLPLCIDALPIVLSGGSPAGGSYSGSGVNSGVFNPAIAGAGAHNIVYAYTDGNGCSNSATSMITVNSLPVVNIISFNPVCIASLPFNLTNGSPSGGIYSGLGIIGNNFNPATAGLGNHLLNYFYTDLNGCSASDTATITVYNIPVINLPVINPVCDGTPAFPLSGFSPVGGVFSGNGVVGSTFNPAISGLGNHIITYAYTDANGCSNSASMQIIVNQLPLVTQSLLPDVCLDAAPFLLSGGNPIGGSYSGTGVNTGIFNAMSAGAGLHAIQYAYTDINGCSNGVIKNIQVNPLPVVTLGIINPVCLASAPIPLTNGNPTGGTYSGIGVSGGFFNPQIAGLGNHLLHYVYTDINGCSNSDSITLTVYDIPTVTISNVNSVCINAPILNLTGATPAGGVYSGIGILGNTFDPALAGAGTHLVSYTFTDPNGCSNFATTGIIVNPLPLVSFSALNPVCENENPIQLATGFPLGGLYSGSGVTSGFFNPQVTGPGSYLLSYTYTDTNGCSAVNSITILVHSLPIVQLGSTGPLCMNDPSFQLVTGSPLGGIYSGTGVLNGLFSTVSSGPGSTSVFYEYTDVNGCTGIDSTVIIVNTNPLVTISALNEICLGTSPFQLNVGNPAGGIFSGNGISLNMFNSVSAGTGNHSITYTYTDTNGCTNAAVTGLTVLPLPVVSLTTPVPVCENNFPFVLSGGSPSGGVYSGIGVVNNLFYAGIAGSGSHQLAYTYTDTNACSNMALANMVVNPVVILDAGEDDTLCIGQSLQLNASGSNTINWQPAIGLSCVNCLNPIATVTSPIQYVISSITPCSVNDTISIVTMPAIYVDAGNDTIICFGESIQLTGTTNTGNFYWNNVGTLDCSVCLEPIAHPIENTYYTFTGSNEFCQLSDSVFISIVKIIVNAGPDKEIILGEQIALQVNGANSYSWSPGNLLNDSLSSTPVATPEITTTFTVTGILNGCSSSDSVTIMVIDIGDAVYVPNAFSPNADGKNDFFGPVIYSTSDSFKLTIFNRWGELVFESGNADIQWDGSFIGQPQPEGNFVYYLTLVKDGEQVVKSGNLLLIR